MPVWAMVVYPMTPQTERAARALGLFDELLDLDSAQQERRLHAVRADEPELADEVARMLAADANASGVIDRGLAGLAATLAPDIGDGSVGPAAQGRRIGPFVLMRLLGRGGMGEVWLAQRKDGDFSQEVALKLCRRGMDSEDMLRRFVQERRILADLSHPGIARFIDGGVGDQGAPWYAMEYVDGMSLTEHARAHGFGVRQRIALMADVVEVVAYAQTRLVVHRDLKPSNILVDTAGRVRLLDFGIAKLLQDDRDVGATATGLRAMSPAYAAPEQILDEPISTATDVYALGVVLHELLTGSLPHQRGSGNLEGLVDKLRHEVTQRPSARLRHSDASLAQTLGVDSGGVQRFSRSVAGELDTIVLTALRHEPARRYASAAALADDLRRWLDGRPVAAQPDSTTYRMRKFVSRHRLAVASACGVLLALIAGLAATLWQASVAREAAQRADAEAESSGRIANFALAMVREQYVFGRKTTEPRTPSEMVAASVESARKELKDDDRARATILSKLGELQAVIDSPARAEPAVAEALQITRKLRGDADPETGDALVALATVRDQGDQLVEAESLLREALQVYARSPGNQQAIVMTRSRLASILRRTNRIDEAIAELDLARGIAAEAYGADHPNTIELTGNSAILLEQIDRLGEAEAGYRNAIAGYQRIDKDFPRMINPLFNLGMLLGRTGRYAEARASAQRALDVGRRQAGAADPRVLFMEIRYAELLRRIGETAAAEHERDAIDAAPLLDRPVQHSRLIQLNAQLLADRARHDEALVELDKAESTLDGAAGELVDSLAGLDIQRADILIAAGRWADASIASQRARQRLDGEERSPVDLRAELARIEAQIAAHDNRLADAHSMLAAAIRTLTAVTGADTVEIVRLELDLAGVLEKTPGRGDQAARTRVQARARLDALGVDPLWARPAIASGA